MFDKEVEGGESRREGQHWSLQLRTQPGGRRCGNQAACAALGDLMDLTDTEVIGPLGSGCRLPFVEILGWEEGERHTVLSVLLYNPKASI